MRIDKLELPTTIQWVRDTLQTYSNTVGVFFDYDRICEYVFHYSLELAELTNFLRELTGFSSYEVTNRSDTINILTKRFEVPTAYLLNESGKVSTDKFVMEKLLKVYAGTNTQVEAFLKIYQDAQTKRVIVSSLKGYKDLPFVDAVDADNHRLVKGQPIWNILNTSRLSASNPGIQQLNRDLGDIISAPKGWQIVRGDSGQIEPRIMWSVFMRDNIMFNLIKAYDDAYFAYYDYVTMSPERMQALSDNFEANFKKIEITDEVKKHRQEMKRMSLAAGYGSSLPADKGFDATLAKLYTDKIIKHPARNAWLQRVTYEVDHGTETFYGAFGTPVTPDETDKYSKSDNGWRGHLIRCGINNPVQTTASELMMFAVKAANEIIQTKCKNSAIAYYKHDEGCFYVEEDHDMQYAEELGACQSYDVLDWIPIHSETEIGKKKVKNDVVRVL